MNLKILLPGEKLLEERADRIRAAGEEGEFGILPRHIDYATVLVPGILVYERKDSEHFVAVREGVLVKSGDEVTVTVRDAVAGEDLGTLRKTVEKHYEQLGEREKRAKSALAGLESDFIRRFLEMEEHGRS